MVDIRAFRAWRYDCQVAGSLETLIAQPFDDISEADQEAYYAINPYNIIRLEYGKTFAEDDESNNRYSRAAADFTNWREKGVLKLDDLPSHYPYVQQYTIDNQTFCRRGFLTTIMAVGYENGKVLPHEETLPVHREDRYSLMDTCRANFSPIFGLYDDESRAIDGIFEQATKGVEPFIDLVDEAGVRHQVWQVSDADTLLAIENAMQAHVVYIADGHHRYETASQFAENMAAQGIFDCDHLMIQLVNLHDPGLTILPTHRLVKNLGDYSANALRQALNDVGFAVWQQSNLSSLQKKMANCQSDIVAFGFYSEGQYYLLMLDKDDTIIAAAGEGYSANYQRIDVNIVHSLILEALCGIWSEASAGEDAQVSFVYKAEDAIKAVESGEYQFALLLNAPKVPEMLAITAEGERMPHKSTFFYPKIIAGLVINELGL